MRRDRKEGWIGAEARGRRKDELVRIAETKGERIGREGSVYSRSILHFAIPILALQRCIVSIAANGRSVFVAIYLLRRFDVAIGSRLIARRLRFAVNRLVNGYAYVCVCRQAIL